MKQVITLLLLLQSSLSFGQKSLNDYFQYYPIGEDPSVRMMSSYTEQEEILFEASPTVRFSFYNNFDKGLLVQNKKHVHGWYLSFRPQLRMFVDNSLPVRTPSYRVFLGTQHLFRIDPNNQFRQSFVGFSLESGHYSNGQDGSAFSELYPDGSSQSDSIYATITSKTDLSKILNRRSGNFSTNLTELIINYRTYKLDENHLTKFMHSVNVGYTLYHNEFLGFGDFGGYSENDIEIYGRHRFMGQFEVLKIMPRFGHRRFSVSQTFNYIVKPHKSVNPFRSESRITLYPFQSTRAIGLFGSYIYGHDTYNFRFVDAGHQFSAGITWSQFPAFILRNLK